MAWPGVSVACVRENPGHAAELGTQVLMGTPLKVLGQVDGWVKIETPEGYIGYVIDNSIEMQRNPGELERWRGSRRVVVISEDQTYIYNAPKVSALHRVTDVVNGVILQVADAEYDTASDKCARDGAFVKVKVPFGREGYILSSDVTALSEFGQTVCNRQKVIDFALRMMGQPYLWGGTSQKGVDCSGLVKAAYLSEGFILPRNASQQAKIGVAVDKDDINSFEPGDLLFFGKRATGRINHVGIYIGDGRFVHSSGRVKINSLRRGLPDYTPLTLVSVRRLDDDTLNGLRLVSHAWYM